MKKIKGAFVAINQDGSKLLFPKGTIYSEHHSFSEFKGLAERDKIYFQAIEVYQEGGYREALDLYNKYQRIACHEAKVNPGLWKRIEDTKRHLSPSEKSIAELSPHEAGAMYDSYLESEKSDYHLLKIKQKEISRWQQALEGKLKPERRAALQERIEVLQRESRELQEEIAKTVGKRKALWEGREDLRQVLLTGHQAHRLEGWDLTYAKASEKIAIRQGHENWKQYLLNSTLSPDDAAKSASVPLHPRWLEQKGWDKIIELNGSEFIIAKKENCQPDYDIPEGLNQDGLVIVIFKAAWCKEPCDLEIEGFKELQKEFPSLRVAVFLVYSEDELGLAEMQRIRGHQNMTEMDLLIGHGTDEKGYSRVGTKGFPTARVYDNGPRIAEHQTTFVKQNIDGENVFDRERAIAFLNAALKKSSKK